MSIATLEPTTIIDATIDLDAEEARALTTRIRGLVTEAVALLRQAYDGRVWLALGYTSWGEYLTKELGGALAGLPVDDRDQATVVLKESGMSNRAIGAATGRSEWSVRETLKEKAPQATAAPSVGMDGKTYIRSAATAQAIAASKPMLALPGPKKTTTALDLLEAAGTVGMTIPELQKKKRWTYSQTSTTLSRLNAQRDADGLRRVERLAERRGQYAVYVLPEYVVADGVLRDVLAPGQRLPRA